ncbi:hypothetical protein C9E81_00310 [Paracoccus alkanivorans]|uniref:TonB-dependent receptor n=2 Tax=Paracoccus alkanivorans TaxID=2116655 RepID=A0A3M0MHW7_9RHOB|nr:hypothetical protein C9E81_00310 [Paracoccus alkanivorans]
MPSGKVKPALSFCDLCLSPSDMCRHVSPSQCAVASVQPRRWCMAVTCYMRECLMTYSSEFRGTVVLAALLAGPVMAQDGTVFLPPITLIALAGDGTDSEVVTSDDIEKRHPDTLNDLFSDSPEVAVSGANRMAAQKVYVRGIEETMLGVTVDGARQGGNMYAHSGNFSIDPYLLKRVEVDAGAGSALAGPGALGGSLRYQTKDPEDLLLPGRNQGVMLKFSAQTSGSRIAPAMAFYGAPDDRFAYLVYGTKSWARNYEDGDGNKVADTDNEPMDGLVKLRFRPADGQELTFSTTYRRDEGRRAYRSNFGIPDYLPAAIPEDQQLSWRSTSLNYRYDPAGNPMVDMTLSAYDTHSRLYRDIEVDQTADWYTRGIDLRNRSEFGRIAVTYGYDYTWTKSRGRDGEGRDNSETGGNHGLYAQVDYTPTDRWLLSAGLRYDRAVLEDMNGNDYKGVHFSPNLRLRYEPNENLTLFASWGEAFRGVQPYEGLTLIWPLGLGDETDTSLTGELARTAELGFDYDGGGWRMGMTAFTSKVEDKIRSWQGRRSPWFRQNDGDIESKGGTINLGRDWGNLSADLQYSHIDVKYNGKPVSPGDWLNGVTPGGDKVILALGYDMPSQRIRIDWTSTFVLKQTDLPADFELDNLPSYDVHDLSVTWRPKENQSYSLALTNIFDKQYLDHSTAYYGVDGWSNLYEMGRSLRVSGTIRF